MWLMLAVWGYFSFKQINLKMSAKWQPFCLSMLSLNVLSYVVTTLHCITSANRKLKSRPAKWMWNPCKSLGQFSKPNNEFWNTIQPNFQLDTFAGDTPVSNACELLTKVMHRSQINYKICSHQLQKNTLEVLNNMIPKINNKVASQQLPKK